MVAYLWLLLYSLAPKFAAPPAALAWHKCTTGNIDACCADAAMPQQLQLLATIKPIFTPHACTHTGSHSALRPLSPQRIKALQFRKPPDIHLRTITPWIAGSTPAPPVR